MIEPPLIPCEAKDMKYDTVGQQHNKGRHARAHCIELLQQHTGAHPFDESKQTRRMAEHGEDARSDRGTTLA